MDIRFQQHLLQTQTNEMVKYIDQLENNNGKLVQFIQQHGLGEELSKMMEEAPVPEQTSEVIE